MQGYATLATSIIGNWTNDIKVNNYIREIIFSLPCQQFKWYPNVLAVKNPKNGNLVILKSRLSDRVTQSLTEEHFEYFDKSLNWDEFDSLKRCLSKKFIMISHNLLNKRGLEALYQL